MTHLAVKPSRWFNCLMLLGSSGFVAAGVFILLTGGPGGYVGWMSIVFFGVCALIFAWQLMEARPRLIISDEGIFDRSMGVGVIPWHEVEGAFVRSISGNDFICLTLAHSDDYLPKLSGVKRAMISANEALGFTPFCVNLSGLALDTDQVFELIMKKCEEYKQKRGEQITGANTG